MDQWSLLLKDDKKNIIQSYGKKVKQLDDILVSLTKPLCSERNNCVEDIASKTKEYGCCDHSEHHLSGLTTDFLIVQKIEAETNGWKKEGDKCKYHSTDGCYLTHYKSPLCVGYLCGNIESKLRLAYNKDIARLFVNAMDSIAGSDIHVIGNTIIGRIDTAIAYAELLNNPAQSKHSGNPAL